MGKTKYRVEDRKALDGLAAEMRRELEGDILPFWLPYMDKKNGGFYGFIANDGAFEEDAPKGLVMHSRFLWAYSAAYRRYGKPEYLEAASWAYRFLVNDLYDKASGGFWWILDAKGNPGIREKMIYGQAFAIYGLSEYYRAAGEAKALKLALETYGLLENHAHDKEFDGYAEACDPSWEKPESFALSEVDIACDKSMNTNLHVLEALSSLFLASGEASVRDSLESLLRVYAEIVFDGSDHLSLYFDRDWTPRTKQVSYGHDIESCWLMSEAAEILYGGDWPGYLRERIFFAQEASRRVIVAEGGSLPYEKTGDRLERRRDWWVQAEAVVGMVNAWELSGESKYLASARAVWDYIARHMIDRKGGEWFWGVSAEGIPDLAKPKGGLWKTNYHNGRACLEVMRRAEKRGEEPAV